MVEAVTRTLCRLPLLLTLLAFPSAVQVDNFLLVITAPSRRGAQLAPGDLRMDAVEVRLT
jgi:hypothetical protein